MASNPSSTYKISGLAGWLKEIDSKSKNSAFLKSILEFDKEHFFVVKFLYHIADLERNIPKYGLNFQSKKLLNKLKLDTYVYSDISNKNFQDRKGLLVYGINHNAFFEPIILLSLLNQKNIKLVIYRFYFFLGKNFQKYALPVISNAHIKRDIFNPKKRFDIGHRFHKREGLESEEIKIINQNSLKNASKTLENGGIVIIFPGGAGDELKKWGIGLSKIIIDINKNKRNDISLLPVYFSGMGYIRMLLRLIKAYKNTYLPKLRIGVYFGKEKTISEIFSILGNDISEKSILSYLRKDAFSQYGLKEFPIKRYIYPRYYPLAFTQIIAFLIKLIPFKEFFKA